MIPFDKLSACLIQHQSLPDCRIIMNNRLPRTIAAIITGGGFGISGVILLYVTRNPLACPSLLGINQGSLLGVLLCLIIFPLFPPSGILLFAILGGAIAGLIIYFTVSALGASALKLVLVGQAINAFLYALSQILIILFPNKTGGVLINLNGSLAGLSWHKIELAAPILLVTILITFIFIRKIYVLSLGEETAQSLGVDVNKLLIIIFGLIIVLCSMSVSMVGQLLFFPLIVVHLSKILLKNKNPYHLCITACIVGALLMLASDCIMRYFYVEQEAPLGIFMAFIGAPILIFSSRLKHLKV